MCTTCGCGSVDNSVDPDAAIAAENPDHPPPHRSHNHPHQHPHTRKHPHTHSHGHSHSRHPHSADLHFGQGPAGAQVAGLSQTRMVQIEQAILGKNDQYAGINRLQLLHSQTLALNLLSSPGSGKTTLLTRSIEAIKPQLSCGVIEGDQQTAHDAERIRGCGVQAVQINTGKGCHLDAHMVGHALHQFDLPELDLLFIENVGNLVCPAAFDLGEAHKVVILSVTEGEDKPLKYPDMFAAAALMILNKIDLLPYLEFDVERCIDYARRINPNIEVIQLSASSGAGMDAWFQWLGQRRQALTAVGKPDGA